MNWTVVVNHSNHLMSAEGLCKRHEPKVLLYTRSKKKIERSVRKSLKKTTKEEKKVY